MEIHAEEQMYMPELVGTQLIEDKSTAEGERVEVACSRVTADQVCTRGKLNRQENPAGAEG